MEKIIQDTFGMWGILLIPIITGIFTSFVTEGIDSITPKTIKSIPLLVIVSLFASVIIIPMFPSYFPVVLSWDALFFLILNFFVAVLYYKFLGAWTVKKVFKKLRTRIQGVDDVHD